MSRGCRDRVFEFVHSGLVAPVATMMLTSASIAFDRFGYCVLCHGQVRDLHVANEFSHADSIPDVSVLRMLPAKICRIQDNACAGQLVGGALSHGSRSVLEGHAAVRSRSFALRFHALRDVAASLHHR